MQYREDIVSAHTAAEHLEEKLKAEILFLKEQLQAEQCLKENLEDTLQLEIEGCKERSVSGLQMSVDFNQRKLTIGCHDGLYQGPSSLVMEGHCPEFNSNPDQTHLPVIF